MKDKKKIIGGIALISLFVIVICGVSGYPIMARLPSPQGDKIDGQDVVGIHAGGAFSDSYAWVIPTQTGVVLVDSTGDAKGEALKEEIAGRKVHAILITHGHFDHTSALSLFPDVPVYIGPGEAPLLTGEAEAGGWMARMAYPLIAPPPYTPPILKELSDGEVIEIDGETFQAIHVYGHTQGSMMYLWQDVLFTGDTIVGRGGYVNEIPEPTYDDYDAARRNVSKLLNYSFDRVADGHIGLHSNAFEQVKAYLEK